MGAGEWGFERAKLRQDLDLGEGDGRSPMAPPFVNTGRAERRP
jgi:hypothetical protein